MKMDKIISIKGTIVFTAFLVLFGGCTEYLEENPDSRIEPETVDDYYAIVTGAYPGAWHLFTEIMTDNYRYYPYDEFNSATLESWLTPFYLWSDNYSQNLPVGPEFAWENYYHSIYNANVVLEGIDEAFGDDGFREHTKGEAYLIRAYAHFMLVNLFAEHYDAATAPDDLGIPYALETEKVGIEGHARDNIAFVYGQIIDDAMRGIELINDNYLLVPKYHFNKTAAYAFLSRVYLFMGEWDKCIQYSDLVLQRNSSVRDLIEDVDLYFADNDFEGFSNDYFSSEKENILLLNKVLEWISYPATGFYANEMRTSFFDTDVRGSMFVFNDNSNLNWHSLKFIGQIKDGQQYSNVAMFTVEEVILNRAEALVRKANPELRKAIDDINRLMEKRYENFNPLTLELFQTSVFPVEVAILNRVAEERRLEFCYEGFRWFDLKRFDESVTHWTEFGNVVLESDDPRFVLQIPEKEISANELMVANPRD